MRVLFGLGDAVGVEVGVAGWEVFAVQGLGLAVAISSGGAGAAGPVIYGGSPPGRVAGSVTQRPSSASPGFVVRPWPWRPGVVARRYGPGVRACVVAGIFGDGSGRPLTTNSLWQAAARV